MDLSPCTYTLPEHGDGILHAERLAQGMRWSPPAGHASWCLVERAPWLTTAQTPYSGVVHLPRTCNCPKGPVARAMRSLMARERGELPVKAPRRAAAKRATTTRAQAPEPVSAEPASLEAHGRRVRALEVELEAARYALRMAAKEAHAEGLNYAEIGRRVGLTRARVHQLLAGGG